MMEAEEQGLPGLSSCWEPAGHREQLSGSWHGEKTRWEGWLARAGVQTAAPQEFAGAPRHCLGGQSCPRSPGTAGALRGAVLGAVCLCENILERAQLPASPRQQRPSGLPEPGCSAEQGGQGAGTGAAGSHAKAPPAFPTPPRPRLGAARCAAARNSPRVHAVLCTPSPRHHSVGPAEPRPAQRRDGDPTAVSPPPGQRGGTRAAAVRSTAKR